MGEQFNISVGSSGQQSRAEHHFPVSVSGSSFTDENIVSIWGGTVSAAFFI